MKNKKERQLRIRITETQYHSLLGFIANNPEKFKNLSTLVREALNKATVSEMSKD